MTFSCTFYEKAVPLSLISRRDGGIGRHEGLKILWPEMAVWVQVPLAVLRIQRRESQHSLLCG